VHQPPEHVVDLGVRTPGQPMQAVAVLRAKQGGRRGT
jgi:hypothetical protein